MTEVREQARGVARERRTALCLLIYLHGYSGLYPQCPGRHLSEVTKGETPSCLACSGLFPPLSDSVVSTEARMSSPPNGALCRCPRVLLEQHPRAQRESVSQETACSLRVGMSSVLRRLTPQDPGKLQMLGGARLPHKDPSDLSKDACPASPDQGLKLKVHLCWA